MPDYRKPGENPFLSNCSNQLGSERGFTSCVIRVRSGSGSQKEMAIWMMRVIGERFNFFSSNCFVFCFYWWISLDYIANGHSNANVFPKAETGIGQLCNIHSRTARRVPHSLPPHECILAWSEPGALTKENGKERVLQGTSLAAETWVQPARQATLIKACRVGRTALTLHSASGFGNLGGEPVGWKKFVHRVPYTNYLLWCLGYDLLRLRTSILIRHLPCFGANSVFVLSIFMGTELNTCSSYTDGGCLLVGMQHCRILGEFIVLCFSWF